MGAYRCKFRWSPGPGLPGRAGRSSLESATRAALSSAEPPRLRWAPGGPLARVTARLDPGGPTAPTRSLVNTSSAGLPDSAAATLVVAVDGPSGAGKSTVSRAVARRLGLRYLDTGAMYRAVTWAVLGAGVDPRDAAGVAAVATKVGLAVGTDPGSPAISADGVDVRVEIRSRTVSASVSAVSAVPAVRTQLVA